MPFEILIADDHFPVRLGLEILVKETLGNSTKTDLVPDSLDALQKLRERKYDLFISDVNMPGMSCSEAMKLAFSIQPGLKILLVSVNPQNIFSPIYKKEGAYGYINKAGSDAELRKAIEYIIIGKRYFPSETNTIAEKKEKEKEKDSPVNPFNNLSTREFEVMQLLLKGSGVLEIANTLSLKPSTASTYRGRIFEKLQVKNVMELSTLAKNSQPTDSFFPFY